MGIEFNMDFEELLEIPDDIMKDMSTAGGNVIAKKIQEKGKMMGVDDTGQTINAIKSKKPIIESDGSSVTVSVVGNRSDRKKSQRNGEVAFVNNYGKRGQKPRPFFSQGVAESEESAILAAEKIFNNWIEKSQK